MDAITTVITLLRKDDSTRWVAEQLVASFAQGVSMNVKDALTDARFYSLELVEAANLSSRERQKREKYETTRPYTDQEKLELLQQALERLYVELPAIQVAGQKRLADLGGNAAVIEFVPPDEPEQGRERYESSLELRESERDSAQGWLSEFVQVLTA